MPNEPPTLPTLHLHLFRFDAEDVDQLALHAEGALAAGMQREMILRLVIGGDGGARLHRDDHDARIAQRQLAHMRGALERGGDFL